MKKNIPSAIIAIILILSSITSTNFITFRLISSQSSHYVYAVASKGIYDDIKHTTYSNTSNSLQELSQQSQGHQTVLTSSPPPTSSSLKGNTERQIEFNIANNNNTNNNINPTKAISYKTTSVGAWIPNQLSLESLRGDELRNAIKTLLNQGFNEYYFVMSDFNNPQSRNVTESLLETADNTNLKIIIILVPPSEGGPKGNYNWNGWINYFNTLKYKHNSFDGFTIDDFNWINTRKHTKYNKNIDYMIHSNLDQALVKKAKDLHFYPVIYVEGSKTNTAKRHYYNFIDGVILANAEYYNITDLEHNLEVFSKVFDNKPIKYIIYPSTTSNYIKQGYGPPSDRLVMATISIAKRSANGLIIWRNTNRDVVQDYLFNQKNPAYLSYLSVTEKLQKKNENSTGLDYSTPAILNKNLVNISHSHNRHSWLGIGATDLDQDVAKDMGISKSYKGALVESVVKGGPAFKAGIKGVTRDVNAEGYLTVIGDVIISLDHHKVQRTKDIVSYIKEKSIGDIVKVTVNRNGHIIDLPVTLQSRPVNP